MDIGHVGTWDSWREVPLETLRTAALTHTCPLLLVFWLRGIFPARSPPGLNCSKEKKLILYFICSKAKKSARGKKFTSDLTVLLIVADNNWRRER